MSIPIARRSGIRMFGNVHKTFTIQLTARLFYCFLACLVWGLVCDIHTITKQRNFVLTLALASLEISFMNERATKGATLRSVSVICNKLFSICAITYYYFVYLVQEKCAAKCVNISLSLIWRQKRASLIHSFASWLRIFWVVKMNWRACFKDASLKLTL